MSFAPTVAFQSKALSNRQIREFVVEVDSHGLERVNRINYEIAVLQPLRERLRCKKVWVVVAHRYRNPGDDLPSDFTVKRDEYYD